MFSFLYAGHNLIIRLCNFHFLSQEFSEHSPHELLVENRPLTAHAMFYGNYLFVSSDIMEVFKASCESRSEKFQTFERGSD
jgi:hypothetical protein